MKKLVAKEKGNPLNSKGFDIANTVNSIIDFLWLSGFITPKGNTSKDIQSALDEARAESKGVYLPFGVYDITDTVTLKSSDTLIIPKGTELLAGSAMSGAIIQVGDDAEIADYVTIEGGGRINAAGRAEIGINVKFGRFSSINNLRIDGAVLNAIRLGSASSNGNSYEYNISNIHAMNEQSVNHQNSTGIYYENCSDSYIDNVVVIGYRKGFHVGAKSYSVEFSMTHAWGREVHGAMLFGYLIEGSATLTQCNSDTPFDIIGAGGDLYGFMFSSRCQGSLLRCFSNPDIGPDINIDGRVIPYYFTGEDTTLNNIHVHGGTPTRRFKSFYEGSVNSNNVVQYIAGAPENYVNPI